jgi:hypothetical protein
MFIASCSIFFFLKEFKKPLVQLFDSSLTFRIAELPGSHFLNTFRIKRTSGSRFLKYFKEVLVFMEVLTKNQKLRGKVL